MDKERELFMNMEHAYHKFHEAIAEYINKAEYPINNLTRNLQGQISTAIINMPGGGRIIFRADEWNVILPVKGNPVNMNLLEQWEAKEIGREIEYYSNQLNSLLKRKEELNKK